MNSMSRSEQFINVPGALNLRDFGGYKTETGQVVKKGKLFRCGALNGIGAHAHDDFAALDIGVIIDLRRPDEADMSPTPAHHPYDVRVHIPIDPGSTFHLRESIREPGSNIDERVLFMQEITREIAREHTQSYTQVFRELVDTDRGFLIHCSAGKDRTGFGAAMILTLLGVPHDTVMADYLLSNQATELADRMGPRMRQQFPHMDEGTIQLMAGVREEYLLAALEEVENHFGGARGYFEAVGLSDQDIKALRQRYLLA